MIPRQVTMTWKRKLISYRSFFERRRAVRLNVEGNDAALKDKASFHVEPHRRVAIDRIKDKIFINKQMLILEKFKIIEICMQQSIYYFKLF